MTPLERRYLAAPHVVVAAPDRFAAVIPALIERRRAGERVDLAVAVEEPRLGLLRTVARQLIEAPSPDERAARLDMLAQGKLTISGGPQDAAEKNWYGDAYTIPFQHASAIADRVVFRSSAERERARRLFGEYPGRSLVSVPPDDRVPAPPLSASARGDHVAIWAEGVPADLVDVARVMLWDVRTPLRVLDAATPDARNLIASARAIVALDPDDPAAALALARFGVPLCAPWTSGAHEYLDGAQGYEPWARTTLADALLRALGAAPPAIVRDAHAVAPAPPAVFVRERAPLVSVVMATWNRPHVLREGLRYVSAQTYPNVETIVVNNAGTPVGDVVAAFPGAVLIDRDVNSGNPTVPRNDGLARSRGAFVTFLDDDDVFFPDHVAANVEALERTGGACAKSDFIVRIVERDATGAETEAGWDVERNPGLTAGELLVVNRIGYMTVFARRSAIEAVGPFKVDAGLDELDMWVRLASRYDIVHLDRPTTAYTIRVNWEGTATAAIHHTFGDAYAEFYRVHPADGLPHVMASRHTYLAHLAAQAAPRPRLPRYPIAR
ncbi:MAG TPA: glycosyltransferase family 2 protein [Candidatus Elarobacter sp.]